MGIVTDYIRQVVVQQVAQHGVVVWYDPDDDYGTYVEDLSLPDTKIATYNGSFIALRHEVDELMKADSAPRLVVLVPKERSTTFAALAELEAAGVLLAPGQQPPDCNTKLSFIARNALTPLLGVDSATAIEKQVEQGKLTLTDLDNLATKGYGLAKGVLSVVFQTTNPQDVALQFVGGDGYDETLVAKGALPELALLFNTTFEAKPPVVLSLDSLRVSFVRHVLTTDLLTGMTGSRPEKLATVPVASTSVARDACKSLAANWRLRRDLRESYATYAERISQELGLANIDFSYEQSSTGETFLEVERSLQRSVARQLLERSSADHVALAKARQSTFWSEYLPEVQAQWALTALAGQLLLEADRIGKEVQRSDITVEAIFNTYARGDNPWCMLDTYHRRLERLAYSFDFDLDAGHQHLEQLIGKARDRYSEAGSLLAETFLHHYQGQKFRVPGALKQREIFEKVVKPRVAVGKTAYIWVDALRYEMARELVGMLDDGTVDSLQPAIGTVPTITEIGMAALEPGADQSAEVIGATEGKLALVVQGEPLKDRKDRVAFLKKHAGTEVFDIKLDDLFPSPRKKVREGIQKAGLVLVTSQEIDGLCEAGNIALARRTMDDTVHQLRRAVRILGDLGCESLIITADHGYLFGEEIGSEMKVDSPGGETLDLHRRVWIGRGGTADQAYLRGTLQELGIEGDLEFATPWGFACFKVKGGALAYFHGGLSLEEMTIPVAVITPQKKVAPGVRGPISWTIVSGTSKVTTRFVSVQVTGKAADLALFALIPPLVRVEIRAAGTTISTTVSASYGFEDGTGDVQMRAVVNDSASLEPNTVTLMITGDTTQKAVDILLLDATIGVELASLKNVEMSIAI